MLKISLNTHITRVEGGSEQKTMLLYKKILIMRHHPIICILFDSNLGKLRFYICNMDSCDIKERQVDVHNHPLPFIHLLVRLGLLPVISSRIFSYHKNILLIWSFIILLFLKIKYSHKKYHTYRLFHFEWIFEYLLKHIENVCQLHPEFSNFITFFFVFH